MQNHCGTVAVPAGWAEAAPTPSHAAALHGATMIGCGN
jgi:hypothetical protein